MPKKIKGIVNETDKGTEICCPNCGEWQLLEKYRSFTLNPRHVTELTPVLQCQNDISDRVCMHIFAPTALVFKMHRDMVAGMETKE